MFLQWVDTSYDCKLRRSVTERGGAGHAVMVVRITPADERCAPSPPTR